MYGPIGSLIGRHTRRLRSAALHPYYRSLLSIYVRMLRLAVFPSDRMVRSIDGPDVEKLLFIGDIAVTGYGVLLEELAFPAQVALAFASREHRGCSWSQIASHELVVANAGALVDDRADGIDVAIIALGIPDVLVGTRQDDWSTSMRSLVDSVRERAGAQCRVVITGLPPMESFNPMSKSAQRIIRAQRQRLNDASLELSTVLENVTFAPFPSWEIDHMYIQEALSFRTMHRMWAQAVAVHLTIPDVAAPA